MVAPNPEGDALRGVVDGLIADCRGRVLEIADVRERDHPVDHATSENLMMVLQDLEMLVSLRRALASER